MGIGTLLPFVAKTDEERRIVINSVGVHWEGNQNLAITRRRGAILPLGLWCMPRLFPAFIGRCWRCCGRCFSGRWALIPQHDSK